VHEARLPGSLLAADEVVLLPPAARGLDPDRLLDAEAVCRVICERKGCACARVQPDAAAAVRWIAPRARAGDWVLALSNGGFDDFHRQMLAALESMETTA
ncbi:MAG: hypothetical protein R8K47_02680, partial [Mariprofundaceae bacterium]